MGWWSPRHSPASAGLALILRDDRHQRRQLDDLKPRRRGSCGDGLGAKEPGNGRSAGARRPRCG